MKQHTKAPWDNGLHHAVWNGGRRYAHIRSHGNLVPIAAVVLGVEGYGHDEGEANARLIAAAPDMLAALKLAEGRLALLMRVFPDQHAECDHPTASGGVLNSVRAAIARAEGGKEGEAG